MSIATLTNTEQMTIPKDVLIFLGIKIGDKLDFMIEKDHVILRPAATVDVRDLKGILKRETNKIVSIEEMNAAIVRGATGEPE
ncbi:AbrB/MazE/SpoVT family DNA-binding domain-containing protein [Candidatus Marithrix sp. Canyon 246]|uniref:AbrB/MazE/SpoVT family DNA-binding domain-containing protein n=1 Tax=Candidatus Marithrix sp. Canyon 246 TaxID=1827136 RepID=UPI000849FEAA|nr:AbrB/MazE/SpoVT family DNA-binding domain-containing protein [Candidatus Marithrix sp. Canyon 246]